MEIAEQAAAEVRAQLPEQTVDVVLSDGDPTLRVGEAPRVGRESAAGGRSRRRASRCASRRRSSN